MNIYETVDDAYRDILYEIENRGEHVAPVTAGSSPSAGVHTVELLGHSFTVTNPRARVIRSRVRPINVAFPFGAFVHFLVGRHDVESTQYYNPMAASFSDDGTRLRGAYGPRVFSSLAMAMDLLKRDPSTRRAVLNIFSSQHDLVGESKDVPCPVAMQFLCRGGKLHAIVTFRSQNAAMVYPYDIILFTMIHEWVAVQTGMELGRYIQHTGSMHFYGEGAKIDERVLVRHVLGEQVPGFWEMPAMTPMSQAQLSLFLFHEEQARLGRPVPPLTHLPRYWQVISRLFECVRYGQKQLRDPMLLPNLFKEEGF